MADDDDLKELQVGNLDLVHRDFRGVNLSGMDLPGRDFSEAHLEKVNFEKANLSKCNFHRSKTSGMNAKGANLSGVNAKQTVIFSVNFENANLSESTFERAHLTNANLTGADLRGADFKKAVINEGNTFENCVVNETTMFDGASIFRPLSRQSAFRFYRVERGVLVRKVDEELSAAEIQVPEDAIRINIEENIGQVLNVLSDLTPSTKEVVSSSPGIGHNNPPEETPIDRQELDDISSSLRDIQTEIQRGKPEKKKVLKVAEYLQGKVKKIMEWSWKKIELATDEFAKEVGKKLASVALIVSTWLALSSSIGDLSELLIEFANKIF